jgi:hypothetical protein
LKQITPYELCLSSIKVKTLICSVGPSVLFGFYFPETVSKLEYPALCHSDPLLFAVFLPLALNIM